MIEQSSQTTLFIFPTKSFQAFVVFFFLTLFSSQSLQANEDQFLRRTLTTHICNKSTFDLEISLTSYYQMYLQEMQLQDDATTYASSITIPASTSEPNPDGVCALIKFKTRWCSCSSDKSNQMLFDVTAKKANGNDIKIAQLNQQGVWYSSRIDYSCSTWEPTGVQGGWQFQNQPNGGYPPGMTCYRPALENFGGTIDIYQPVPFILQTDTSSEINHINLAPGDIGELGIKNMSSSAATSLVVTVSSGAAQYFLNDTEKLCNNISTLPERDYCRINYKIPANPEFVGPFTIRAKADNKLTEWLGNISSSGHFTIVDAAGNAITERYINPGDTGTLTLQNTGGSTITNIVLTKDPDLLSYVSSECPNSLSSKQSCTIYYDIPINADFNEVYSLNIAGSGADNTPVEFNLGIFSKGNLVFRSDGKDIFNLDIFTSPGGTSTINIELSNTGGSAMGISIVNLPESLTLSTKGSCYAILESTGEKSLAPGQSCFIQMALQTNASPGKYQLVIDTSNADTRFVTLPITIVNNGYFQVEDNGKVINNLYIKPNSAGAIQIINRGGTTIQAPEVIIPSAISTYFGGFCKFTRFLNPGDGCVLTYNTKSVQSFTNPGNYSIVLKAKSGASNSGYRLPVDLADSGHLIFVRGQQEVHSMDLVAGGSGKVKIRNTGNGAVESFKLEIPQSYQSYFPSADNKCATRTTLGSNSSCNILFTIPSTATSSNFAIGFTGSNVDNSTNQLAVSISSLGHLVFRHQGNDINTLELAPGDSGFIQLLNTGNQPITNFVLSQTPTTTLFQNHCDRSIPPQQSCNLNYNIPTYSTLNTTIAFDASGSNANNLPRNLQVGVYENGHLEARENGSAIGYIVLEPGNSGNIQLLNAGGSTITNVAISIPSSISNYVLHSCPSILAPADNCVIRYTSPQKVLKDSADITITGISGKNNHGVSLTLLVLPKKPYVLLETQYLKSKVKSSGLNECLMTQSGNFDFLNIYFHNCSELEHSLLPDEAGIEYNHDESLIFAVARNKFYTCKASLSQPDCTITPLLPGTSSPVNISGFTVNANSTSLFLADDLNNRVWTCDLNASGGIVSCANNPNLSIGDNNAITNVVLSPNGSFLYLSTSAHIFNCALDSQSRITSCRSALTSEETVINGMSFTPDGLQIFVSINDGYFVCGVRSSDGSLLKCFLIPYAGGVYSISFSENGKHFIASTGKGYDYCLTPLTDTTPVCSLNHYYPYPIFTITNVALSKAAKLIFNRINPGFSETN